MPEKYNNTRLLSYPLSVHREFSKTGVVELTEKIKQIRDEMLEAGFVCDYRIATVLYLAEAMQKPVLIEGPAGVGKTAVAQAFSRARGLELIRLQCYEGIDEPRALYEWNYKKQLLHIQACAYRQPELREIEREIFSEEYLLARPLLRAITAPARAVLLIDEIDKVDFDFEAMLLELLAEFQVTLPELGTFKAREIPHVFITSNATRELSEALKRRCLYLHLAFPAPDVEARILALQVPDLAAAVREKVVRLVQQIRKLDLKKPPSIAESIDWARALFWLAREDLDLETFRETASVILKYQEDIERIRQSVGSGEEGLYLKPEPKQGWR
jgi:MoxR-like ATPase